MFALKRRFAGHTGGATAIEYGLIAGLIALIIVAGLGTLSTSINDVWTAISDAFEA